MKLNLNIEYERGVYRAEVSDSADDWGVQHGSWATSGTLEDAVGSALRSYGVNDYFAKRQAEAEDREPMRLARVVAVTTDDIRSLIDRCMADEPSYPVTIDYTDREGNDTTRAIRPVRWEDRGWGATENARKYLVAVDVDKDEARSFRLDRIERAEIA